MMYTKPPNAIYHESTDVKPEDPNSSWRSQLEISVKYQNGLSCPVTIIGRDGIPFKLPNDINDRSNVLSIIKTYRIDMSVDVDPVSVFFNAQETSADRDAIIEAYTNAVENQTVTHNRNHLRFSVKHTIDRDSIVVDAGGCLYNPDFDIMVSVLDDAAGVTHPYSIPATRRQILINESNINDTDKFGYSIYIISNDGAMGDRYVNINGEVFLVPSSRNNSLRNGIYLCSSSPMSTEAKRMMPRIHHYSYEEGVEKLKLFKSRDEAATYGDVFSEREREIEERALNIKNTEADLKERKLKLEQELIEGKRKLEEMEHDRKRQQSELEHERSIKSLREKDYYESRSNTRKDSLETVKFVAVIVPSILSLITLWFKTK